MALEETINSSKYKTNKEKEEAKRRLLSFSEKLINRIDKEY